MDDYLLTAGGTWLVLQVSALWLLRGWWRKAALLPAAAMVVAFVIAALGVIGGSNIAPIWVFLALPVCLTWIVILWIVRGMGWAIAGARA